MSTLYGLGGYDPNKPNGNKVEESDLVVGTFTRWDAAGNVLVTRPLTPQEIAALTPQAPPIDPTAANALVQLIDQSGALTVADLRAAAAEAAGVV